MQNNATFRQRVREFWRWFPDVAPVIADALRSGNGLSDLPFDFVEEVRERVGGLSWVFGPGQREDGFSFTVTGEGQRAKQLLSHYWLSHAVAVPGWDFYCSRQPSPPDQLLNLAIDVGDSSVNAETLMIATEVVDADQAVNIKAWHESFENIPDEARFQILYLLLDEALGEYVTQTKLGNLQLVSGPDAMPLTELPSYLESLWTDQGWEHQSPLETYSGYSAEPSSGFDRADTMTGYTCVPRVVLEFLNGRGTLAEDPVAATGAEYLFVEIETDVQHHDDPLHYRTELEEEIAKHVLDSGYVIGGATGTNHLYIDLVVFDGDRSKAAINAALVQKNIRNVCQIKPFN